MDSDEAKRPLFDWKERAGVANDKAHIRQDVPSGQLTLAGPSAPPVDGHLPVRGDLAHVRLAGICFVPHYAAPMPHRVTAAGAVLRTAADAGADKICSLAAGSTFDVLDIAGGWCWGETGEGGPVGYVEQAALEVITP